MTAHHCHARGCPRHCPPRLLMCPPCWATVPPALSPLVYGAMRAGRKAGNHPNGAWMLAADACITAAAWAAGRPVPPHWLANAMEFARAQDGDDEAERAAAEIIAAVADERPLANLLRRLWQPADNTAAAQAISAGRRAREALDVRWDARDLHEKQAITADELEAAFEQWSRAELVSKALGWALPGVGEPFVLPPPWERLPATSR